MFMFVGATAARGLTLNVSVSTNDYVVATEVAAAGRSIAQAGLQVSVVLANGVVIGSTSTSTAAFSTGGGWAAGTLVSILVPSGSARIQGKGGAGGDGGFESQTGTGRQAGGGGGGGAGTQVGAGGLGGREADTGTPDAGAAGAVGTATAGGSGGQGVAGGAVGNTILAAEDGFAGGVALEATSGGPNIELRPSAGATLEVWGGGGGGGGGHAGLVGLGVPVADGGAGGGPGLDGAASEDNGFEVNPGGANGTAYSTPGAATITEVGPGTIDDRGT